MSTLPSLVGTGDMTSQSPFANSWPNGEDSEQCGLKCFLLGVQQHWLGFFCVCVCLLVVFFAEVLGSSEEFGF